MRKGLTSIMFANIICLIINIISNFLVPKNVSIDTYSLIKTYSLYIAYAGFFSLGYNDGMYLQYGGKDLASVNKKRLADNFINYTILISIMLFLVLITGIIKHDYIILAFSFGMFSYNILGYLKSLYQATGEFSAYGKALNAEKIVVFIATLILIFVFHSNNPYFYIGSQVITGLIIVFILIFRLDSKIHFIKLGRFRLAEFKENISSGFILMLGNFSSSIFTGLDRWFVKFLLPSMNFAMYSFAVSMESLITIFISPITVSMYNYFCKGPRKEEIIRIKQLSLIWGIIVIAAAFPAKFILEKYLTNYMQANSIIFVLFAAQLFYVVVKGIYVNIYKAEKRQNEYLKQMIAMIFIGFILNVILFLIFKNMISIAVATLITALIWMYYCEITNKSIAFTIKENISLLAILAVYIGCGYYLNAVVGCLVYFLFSLLVLTITMNSTIVYAFSSMFRLIRKGK